MSRWGHRLASWWDGGTSKRWFARVRNDSTETVFDEKATFVMVQNKQGEELSFSSNTIYGL
jgi:hypothetical protein